MATEFTVYGTVFRVDKKYEPIKALGRGAYGVVWYVAAHERGAGTRATNVSGSLAFARDPRGTRARPRGGPAMPSLPPLMLCA